MLACDDDPSIGSRPCHYDPSKSEYGLDNRPARSDITSVVFTPRFAGAPSAHGVTVDTATGAITLDPPPAPTPTLYNFLLEIEVSHTSTNLPSPWRGGLRIHIHDKLLRIWLTPNPLVGREGARDVRFTVLGEFDDGVIGEITDWTVIRELDAAGNPVLDLFVGLTSDQPGAIGIEPNGQTVKFLTSGTSATITPESRWTAGVASAQARCEPPWSTPVEAIFIDGAGPDERDAVWNLLFLPDGFEASEKDVFEDLVQDLVREGLARNTFLSPYNHLSRSMNYWAAFVASPQPGVSALSEVAHLRPSGANFRGQPIDGPAKPSATAAEWTPEELMHEVGLPVRVQVSLARAELLSAWQALYGSHVTEAKISTAYRTVGGQTIEVWELWRELADRVLANEVSSAFGLGVGGRQSANCTGSTPRYLLINPKRLSDGDFDTFLRHLEFKDSNTNTMVSLGDRWSRSGGEPVCIIGRTRFGAGTNIGWYFTSGIGEAQEHALRTAATNGVLDVLPPSVKQRAPLNLVTTVAHEAAHSFGCGDEYAGDCARGQPPDTADEGNLQLSSENNLRQPGPPPTIDGTKIKWLWPRIAKAGILLAVPDFDQSQFIYTIYLSAGHSAFAVGDLVRLRARLLPDHPQASDPLKVTAVSGDPITVGQTVTAEHLPGVSFAIDPNDFPAGSILLQPVLPPGAPNGDDILLVHPDIVAHITSSNGPLNAEADPTRDCQIDFESHPDPHRNPHLFPVQFATNLPDSLKTGTRTQPTWGSRIVGLYEGGSGFPCGIYHSSGVCLMRAYYVPPFRLSGKRLRAGRDTLGRRIPPPGTLYKFCPICRYLLVDAIDPTKHPKIEAEYARIYPK